LLATSSEYIFIYNGRRERTQYIGASDVLVIKKSIVNSYVTTNQYFYNTAKLFRSDYYDSIRVSLAVDSIMKHHPTEVVLDSLLKNGLLEFDGKNYRNR